MKRLVRSATILMVASMLAYPVFAAGDAEDEMVMDANTGPSDDPNSPNFMPPDRKGATEKVVSEKIIAPKVIVIKPEVVVEKPPVVKVEHAAPTAPVIAEKPAAVEKPAVIANPASKPEPHEIPIIETQNEATSSPEVTFVTGGIGDEEREAIEASAADYNLHVTNASADGEFIGDARVVIGRRVNGSTEQMLNVIAGPLLNVRLPTGTYMLTAVLGEQVKKQKISVVKRGKPVVVQLSWK